MPICQLLTNVSKEKIPKDFFDNLIKVIADVMGKSPEGIQLAILPDTMMAWGGNSDPTSHLTISAINDVLREDVNGKYAKAINTYISDQLNIPLMKTIIKFNAIKAFEVGVGDQTAAEMLAKNVK